MRNQVSSATGMTVAQALEFSDMWISGTKLYLGMEGFKVVSGVLADEVRSSQTKKSHGLQLNEREAELMRGMLQGQLGHAARCENIANRPMAIQQQGWDMERVELLRKIMALAGVPEKAPDGP